MKHIRHVRAAPDEHIRVTRGASSPRRDPLVDAVLFFLLVGAVYAIVQIVVAVVTVLVGLVAILASVAALAFINWRAWKTAAPDFRQRAWLKILACATVSGLLLLFLFGIVRPPIVRHFTHLEHWETGMLWWKRSGTTPVANTTAIALCFWLYWLALSLPCYALVSAAWRKIRPSSLPPPRPLPLLLAPPRCPPGDFTPRNP